MRNFALTQHTKPGAFLSLQELVLIGITVLWGGTFLVIHIAMRHGSPLSFVGLRFLTAGLALLLIFRKEMSGLTRRELGGGMAIGSALFAGFCLQTWGLKTISSSQSAFISALYVPLVPVFQWLVFRRPPKPAHWLGVALAFTGLILLAGPEAGSFSFHPGELVTVLGAVGFACEILLIGHFAPHVDSKRVTVIQLLTAGLLSFVLMPVTGESLPAFSWIWLSAAVGLGLASAVIQLAMNWAQKAVAPSRATVIYAGEPVWGGVFGRMAGDRLAHSALLGAGLIVAGVLAGELKFRRRVAPPLLAETPDTRPCHLGPRPPSTELRHEAHPPTRLRH